jgi:predicted component of type VI protein secretion system
VLCSPHFFTFSRDATLGPPQQTFSIGRSPECDLVLADSSVSRKHAELILLDAGQLFLVDCQSTRGTRLSQHGQTQSVQQTFVSLDAVVEFGDVSMPVRDVVDALRLKYPHAAWPPAARAAAGAGAGAGSAVAAAPWGQETQFVRCQCGVIKERGRRCPECGQ